MKDKHKAAAPPPCLANPKSIDRENDKKNQHKKPSGLIRKTVE